MATCAACGRRVVLGGRRYLRKMFRVQALVTQLDVALHEAHKGVEETPPRVRSALLDVKPLLERLFTEGGWLATDLHEAAHHATFPLNFDRVRTWESTTERVLSELLAAFEPHPE